MGPTGRRRIPPIGLSAAFVGLVVVVAMTFTLLMAGTPDRDRTTLVVVFVLGFGLLSAWLVRRAIRSSSRQPKPGSSVEPPDAQD